MNLRDCLQVSSSDALRFFYEGLRETPSAQDLSRHEALHVASVLANYSQVSCGASDALYASPINLSEVFDRFIRPDPILGSVLSDQQIMQVAAAQCLFMLGFFSNQMRHRHNLAWFESYGRAFYLRTSNCSKSRDDKKVFWLMSRNFALWVNACQEFQEELRIRPYLLQ